jgi:hypothetical protein
LRNGDHLRRCGNDATDVQSCPSVGAAVVARDTAAEVAEAIRGPNVEYPRLE